MRLLKLSEVSERLACSLSNTYMLVQSGALPVHRIGLKKGFRVAEDDLDLYLSRVREGIEPKASPAKLSLRHLRLD